MNFTRLEEKHYIMLLIGLVVLYMLWSCDRDESFDVVQRFPHLPPKHWRPRRRTHWSPWWYYENEYVPAVPKVSHYDSSSYRLPPGKESLINGLPTAELVTPTVEEVDSDLPVEGSVEDIDEVPAAPTMPQMHEEQVVVQRRFNFKRMVAVVLLAIVLYSVYTNTTGGTGLGLGVGTTPLPTANIF